MQYKVENMTIKIVSVIALLFISFTKDVSSQSLQWRNLPNSPVFSNNRMEDICFINANTGWAVVYSGKVFRTTNGGSNWDTLFKLAGGSFRSIGFFDEQTGLLGTLSDDSALVLFRTTNGRYNFTAITEFPAPGIKGTCGINILNDNTAYACGRWDTPARIIKTTNKGISWSSFNVDTLLVKSLVDCYFWSSDSGIAVGGSNPLYSGNAVVIKTVNGGNNWQQVYRSSRSGEYCWKICYLNLNNIYVSIQGPSIYYLKSTNGGNNWVDMQFRPYNQQGIGFVDENKGWIGGWSGPTYETSDAGLSWHLAGWGRNVNRFRFINDTIAYAVGERIYKYSRETVGINLISSEIPSSFYLSQNYPNPFNPVTHLEFGISKLEFVSLKVYDAIGKEVAILVNGKLTPGRYEYEFNGADLPSGIYFYKIETDDFSTSKRMILLK